MNLKRVVVTGMGVVTSLGFKLDEYWDNLVKGKSGISYISAFDTQKFDTKFAGEIKNFDPTLYLDRKEARRMDRFTQFALIGAEKAIADAGLDFSQEDVNRWGVIVSSGIGGMTVYEREVKVLLEKGPGRVSPFFIPMLIADISPGYISMKYGLKGPNYATTSACASSSHAIGDAFLHIRHGRTVGVVAGGTEAPITQMGVAGFNAMKAISERNDAPEKASRPFDLNRDGFVMGEGGAILVLEELEHACARGARIYCEIIGCGFSGDAYHITAPVPGGEGAVRAMRDAMQEGMIQPHEVDYINAHGTSTPANDKTESDAIHSAFGDHANKIAISSTKSMVGHLLGASGAVEAIATILAIQNDMVHPTINYETPDPECDLDYVPNVARKMPVNVALSNSFGFGGHNVCLAFKKYR